MQLKYNTSNQFLYIKFYNWITNRPVPYAGLTGADVSINLYLDGSSTAIPLSTSVFVELGNGNYAIQLNATQTNCQSGVLDVTTSVSPHIISDSVPFTTSSIISEMKAATYDGISQEKLNKMLIAFISNKVSVTIPENNTKFISYKDRSGSNEVFNITVNSVDGSRSNSGTIL